jgi:hypothetical protein
MAKEQRNAPSCPSGSKFSREAKACLSPAGENALTYKINRPKAGSVARPAAFDYWTASAVPASKAAERATCLVETVEYKGKAKGQAEKVVKSKDVRLPFRCPPGARARKVGAGATGASSCVVEVAPRSQKPFRCPTGTTPGTVGKGKAEKRVCEKPVEPVRDWSCGPSGNPCSTARKTCPVQFVWRDAKPNLRFCGTKLTASGQPNPKPGPGWLVPVASVQEAVKLSEEACERWSANGYKLNDNDPLIARAKAAYPKSDGLGRSRAKRRRKPRR